MELDISKIKQVRLKESQYFAEESAKTQIYLHHTAGNGNAEAVRTVALPAATDSVTP